MVRRFVLLIGAVTASMLAADMYGVTTLGARPSAHATAQHTTMSGRSASSPQPATTPPAPARSSPDPFSLIARPSGDAVDIYPSPGSPRPIIRMPSVWLLNMDPSDPIPQVFLVVGHAPGGWLQILLPQRPNGTRGWVRAAAVGLLKDPWRLDVSVGQHTVRVYDGAALIYQGPVATGAPATPTPLGEYYIRVLLRSSEPLGVYGPYAYGLSAHSEALTTFNGGDAEIGLHGNDDASALGHSVTHGCVRMDNAEITSLAAALPLGTPVHIGP